MEETFVNDSELGKHVFYLVSSEERHIGAPVESLTEHIVDDRSKRGVRVV